MKSDGAEPKLLTYDARHKILVSADGKYIVFTADQAAAVRRAFGCIYQTPMMAWPCFISADASGIIAGSD
jgi:hypothetical protein